MFAVLKARRELDTKENADFFLNLITAVSAPNTEDGLKHTINFWREIRNEAVPEFKQASVKWEADRPVIPWKQATVLMMKQMSVMRGLQNGR